MNSKAKHKLRTQKASGLLYLKNHPGWNTFSIPAFAIIQNENDLVKFLKEKKKLRFSHKFFNIMYTKWSQNIGTVQNVEYPLFARPCPVTPKHGFVESRIVKSYKEALKVWKEARSQDPKAEMILMSPVNCRASGVMTPTQISIGPSNNGATKGFKTTTLPICGFKRSVFPHDVIANSPYLEFLFENKAGSGYPPKLVQLRDGPATESTSNYIPKTVQVKKVIKCEKINLIEWEKLVKKLKRGDIVYHPGGSPVSHYAVHAIMNKVPIVFDFKPKVGKKLKANNTRKTLYLNKVIEGIYAGLYSMSTVKRHEIELCLLATHHATALRYDPNGSFMIGVAASLLVKMGFAACIGENRHFVKSFKNRPESATSKNSRISIYQDVLSSYPLKRNKIIEAYLNFKSKKGWITGYGGKKWAESTLMALKLDNSITQFCKTHDEDSFNKVVLNMHGLVNAMHNNGPCLNKFGIDRYLLTQFADMSPRNIMEGAYAFWAWKRRKIQRKKIQFNNLPNKNKIKNLPVIIGKTTTPDKINVYLLGTKKNFNIKKCKIKFGKYNKFLLKQKEIKKLPQETQKWIKNKIQYLKPILEKEISA